MIELDKVEVNAIIAFLEHVIEFYSIVGTDDALVNTLAAQLMIGILETRLKESTDE